MDTQKMMWCWPLKITEYQEIPMPPDARIVCCRVESGVPYLWVICNETLMPSDGRGIAIISGTGGKDALNECDRRYIDTFQFTAGGAPHHVFERIPKSRLGPVEEVKTVETIARPAKPTHHNCWSCGYSWTRGSHGRHDCIGLLRDQRDKLKEEMQQLQGLLSGRCDTCRFWSRATDVVGKCDMCVNNAGRLPDDSPGTSPEFSCKFWRSIPTES